MLISQKLRESNISEYLLYMWQMEDLIRAANCDVDTLSSWIIDKSEIEDDLKREWRGWFSNLIEMMLSEEKRLSGHLQINENVMINLSELHVKLLNSSVAELYKEQYYKSLPFIVEFRKKRGRVDSGELYDCFDMMYGVLMLRLQKREITDVTLQASQSVSALLSQLSEYYKRWRCGELEEIENA